MNTTQYEIIARHLSSQFPTARVEIHTSDTAYATRYAAGRNGRVVVEVGNVERLTFAGADMARFTLADLPRDYANATVMVPASYVVTA